MKVKWMLVILFVVHIIMEVHGAKILGVFPTPCRSHNMVLSSLMVELSKRGHNVTVITADPMQKHKQLLVNFTEIDMHDISYAIFKKTFDYVEAKFEKHSIKQTIERFYDMLMEVSDAQFSTPELQNLIKDEQEHFDLVISEALLPIASAFKVKFKSPLILITSLGFAPHHMDIFGMPGHPVIFPDNFAPYDPNNLAIWHKIDLLYRYVAYKIYYYYIYMPKFNALLRKYFGQHQKSADAIEREADMIFVNHNPIWHGVQPTVPAIVGITGIHIKPPAPLPDHIQKLLDESPQGVIYFSFGTNVNVASIPQSEMNIFVETFKKLPYQVIWKCEGNLFPNKSHNVYTSSWLPQTDILAHPNIKVFITQAGQQSVEESIHRGVPVLAIPFIFDQISNGFRIQKHGVGRQIKMEDLSVKVLTEALADLVTNPSYRENCIRLRDLFADQPQNSMERAIWWSEFVIRHKGAKHLRSPAAGISLFDFIMLDVWLFLTACLTVVLYILFRLKRLVSKYRISIKTGETKKLA